MASITKYAGTVSQTTGGKYCTFSNLNNIKNNASGSYAVSNVLIQGKSETPNRPSTITCTNFNFNLPVGAEPTRVVITYQHQKVAGSDYSSKYPKRICNIPAPTISLVGVNGFSSKGSATSTSLKSNTKTFNANLKDNKNLDHTVTSNVYLSRAIVNSNSFGVKINYPTNTNAYNGYMRIGFVRVTVEYRESSYNVNVSKVSGGYNREDYVVQLAITNKNLTSYDPSLTLSSPVGFNYKGYDGTGTITQVNARTFTWDPKLTNKIGTSTMNLTFTPNVTYPSGSTSYEGTFSLTESLNSTISNHTAVITERPPIPDTETADPEIWITNDAASVSNPEIHTVTPEEEFKFDFSLDLGLYCISAFFDGGFVKYPDYDDSDFSDQVQVSWDDGENWTDLDGHIALDGELDLSNVLGVLRCRSFGQYSIIVYEITDPTGEWQFVYTPKKYVKVDCVPPESELSNPNFSIVELSVEELDRLGSGYSYVFQSYLRLHTNDNFTRNWYKNNRIGVFNNPIRSNISVTEDVDEETGEIIETVTDSTDYSNLTDQEIFENAEYWSEDLAGLNFYNNVECEFVYNDDYPLYLIFTGEYPETEQLGFDRGSLTFSEYCIIEKSDYVERRSRGNYPIPIVDLISESNTSECSIDSMNQSDVVVLYDFPLSEGYGTTDTVSVRGIELVGNIEQSDELVLNAKLLSNTGMVGERSIVIGSLDTTLDSDMDFKIGGLGDLWGFNTQDIVNIEDWEIQLSASNVLLEDVANINFGDLQLIIYLETLTQQEINVKVDGEDLSYFGAFIDEVIIPEGLETDTNFITIDGTDTNDPYRQNIREKEIEISLTIGECDIGTSTDMLRQLTKALVNEKDSINRPIPKRIEFSHYPDVYFEYIITDALDIKPVQSYYEVKAKLVIPAGTSYSKQSTTTNISGSVQGLAAVNPKITFKPQGSTIEILELNSKQKFSMTYSQDWQSQIVELDCANRIASLKSNDDDSSAVDISGFVDFNSDWFALKGDYSFSSSNCVIRTVEYTERW